MAEKTPSTNLFLGIKFDSENESIQNVPQKTDIQIKRKILNVIESLLEEKVTDKHLIESNRTLILQIKNHIQKFRMKCRMLTKNDYADVIEERNIMDLCGYPLCSNHVKISRSQQFHIVSKVNRVYNINERKSFCSDMCYKASCHLKLQLSEIPVWFQEDLVDLTLLSDGDNSGSIGELIVLCPKKLLETEFELKSKEDDWLASDDKKLINDELLRCADAFKNLEVNEKNRIRTSPGDKEQWLNNALTENIRPSTYHQNTKLNTSDFSEELNDTDSDHSDNEFFPSEERHFSKKLMPMPFICKVKSPILIKPDKSPANSILVISNPVSLCKIQDILKEWITTDTLSFLNGKMVDSNISQSAQTASHHSNAIKHTSNAIEDNNSCTTTYRIKETASEIQIVTNDNKTSEQTELMKATNSSIETIKEYLHSEDLCHEKRNQPGIVKFKVGRKGGVKLIKNKPSEPSTALPSLDAEEKYHLENSSSATDRLLPMIDSFSQNALRQQVVCTKLKNVFSDILPLIGLHFKVFDGVIRNLISTFRLTASNVMFKPNEWRLLAIVLFRVIMKSNMMKNKISEQFTDDDTFSALLKKSAIYKHLSIQDIDKANELFNFNCKISL